MISLKSLLTEGTLNEDIKRDIDKFIAKLNKQFPDQEYMVSSGGGKYVRITHKNRKGGQESAWGFIALVDNPSKGFQKGDLLKAAGYNTPAKNARGNILNGTAKYDKYSPAYLREELENLVKESKVKTKKTISKQEWSKIPKYNKHIGQDGTKYIMQYSDNLGTYLQAVIVECESVNEETYKVAGRPVTLIKGKKSNGTDWKVKFQNGKETSLSDVIALIKPFPKDIKESELKGYLAADVVDDIVKAIGSKMVKGHVKNAPNRNYIYLKLTDIKFGNDVVKMLKSKFGIDAKVDKTFGNIPTVSFASKKVVSEFVNEEKRYKKGDKLKIKLKNGKKIDVVFDMYSRTKGVALGKFKDNHGEYDIKPFDLDAIIESVNEEDKSAQEILRGLRDMAMGDLERIEDYAEMISDRMEDGQELSSWMYSQITLAVDQLNSVHDAMDGKDGIKEAKSDYEVYHKSYTSAIEAARNYAEKKGYEINDDDAFTKIGVGPRKPSPGKTNRFSIELTKGGKPQRKMLHIQVYGMKNSYELNAYIQ